MSLSGSKCSRRKRIRDGVRKGSKAYAMQTSRDKPFFIVLIGTEGGRGCVTTAADYNFVRLDSKIPRCPHNSGDPYDATNDSSDRDAGDPRSRRCLLASCGYAQAGVAGQLRRADGQDEPVARGL